MFPFNSLSPSCIILLDISKISNLKNKFNYLIGDSFIWLHKMFYFIVNVAFGGYSFC